MQFLIISKDDTLISLTRVVGSQNVDILLAENGIQRTPRVGKVWNEMCDNLLATQPTNVSSERKSLLLNLVTDSQEVFERVCLLDEDGWKIFSAFQAFRDALKIPQILSLPYSARVIGSSRVEYVKKIGNATSAYGSRKSTSSRGTSNTIGTSRSVGSQPAQRAPGTISTSDSDPVSSATYRSVVQSLKEFGEIKQEIFNSVNTQYPSKVDPLKSETIRDIAPSYSFPLPWGKIQICSSLSDVVMDIPAYPEQVDTSRAASYTAMPNIIYQYEPWIMYENSGPREQSLVFHLHRDLWSGNHLDGRANELIRFCEANTFPEFNGSTVNAPIVKIYIDGSCFITGVMTRTDVSWKGPIGLDNWFLEFELTLTMQEVSDTALDFHTVRQMSLIGS